MNKALRADDGQILFFGVVLLCIFSLIALFLLHYAESAARYLYAERESEIKLLSQQNQRAQVLNQISLNNRNILTALATSVNAYLEAQQIARWIALSRPSSETDSLKRKIQNKIIPTIVSREVLDVFPKQTPIKTDDDIESIFASFSKRSKRALKIADGLSTLNRLLVKRLVTLNVPTANQYLVESKPETAFCLATRIGHVDTNVTWNDEACTISAKHALSLYQSPILELKERIKAWASFTTSSASIALTFVRPASAVQFLQTFTLTNRPSTSPLQLSAISNFVQVLLPTLRFEPSGAPSIRVTSLLLHPDLFSNCNNTAIYNFRTLNMASSCGLQENLFLRAFLRPQWTPVIASRHNLSEGILP